MKISHCIEESGAPICARSLVKSELGNPGFGTAMPARTTRRMRLRRLPGAQS